MADTNFVPGTVITKEWLNEVNRTVYDLPSTAIGKGASMLGINDAGGLFAATQVEAALQELASRVKTDAAVSLSWFSSAAVGDNWAPVFQAAHDFVEAFTFGGAIIFPVNFNKQFHTGVIWNPSKVAVDMNGATMDFTSTFSDAYGITLRWSYADLNFRPAVTRTHPWRNGTLLGSGNPALQGCALDISNTGTNMAAGVSMANVAFVNWWRDIDFRDGSFFFQGENLAFVITGGTGYDKGIFIRNAPNSGENVNFSRCAFLKVHGVGIYCENPDANVICRGCSADYTKTMFEFLGGCLDWDGYIENSLDTDHWVKVSGENTLVRIAGDLNVSGAKSAFEIFSVADDCTNGGLDLDINLRIGNNTYSMDLVKGGAANIGRVQARFRGHYRTAPHPAIGAGCNIVANKGFETASLAEFSLTGTVVPDRSGVDAHTGGTSLRFLPTSANNPQATFSTGIRPGQQFVGRFWVKSPNLAGTSGVFFATFNYLDKGGNVLSSTDAILLVNVNQATWLRVPVYQFGPAPVGTATASITWGAFGVSGAATPVIYIDDLSFAVV